MSLAAVGAYSPVVNWPDEHSRASVLRNRSAATKRASRDCRLLFISLLAPSAHGLLVARPIFRRQVRKSSPLMDKPLKIGRPLEDAAADHPFDRRRLSGGGEARQRML